MLSYVDMYDGLRWYSITWHGMAWDGMVWCGAVWLGMAGHGMAWCGVVWHGMVGYGMVNRQAKNTDHGNTNETSLLRHVLQTSGT